MSNTYERRLDAPFQGSKKKARKQAFLERQEKRNKNKQLMMLPPSDVNSGNVTRVIKPPLVDVFGDPLVSNIDLMLDHIYELR